MAKQRQVFDLITTKAYTLWVNGEWRTYQYDIKRHYSSFPSTSTAGFPDSLRSTPLTCVRFDEFIGNREVRDSSGRLVGVYTQPVQFDLPTTVYTNRLKAIVTNKAIEKFMDQRVNLANIFAERQKTINMISHRLTKAYYALRLLKRGKVRQSIQTLTGKNPKSKDQASLYLEWVYGWIPLASDLYGLCKMYPPSPEVLIKYGRHFPYNSGIVGGDNLVTAGNIWASCKFILRMDSPLVSSAEQLGLANPAVVAWEVMPYSFIIDWFIPIGTYLQSLTVFNGFTMIDKCVTLSYRLDAQNRNLVFPSSYRQRFYKDLYRDTSYEIKFRSMFRNPLSIVHGMNTLALIYQLKEK